MDTVIAPQTLQFLSQLSRNNHREWFERHKQDYIAAKENMETFIAALLERLAEYEPEFGLLRAKDCVFRIYRDIRFSKDKTPYKNHLAAGISKGGKRVHVPGYHLHLTPGGQSFFGGGLWHPDKEMLAKVRQEIDYNFEAFSGILKHVSRQRVFDALEDKESLVRPPKSYDADNPAIAYIKMKNFVISRPFTDEDVLAKDFLSRLVHSYQLLRPFNSFIEQALD